LAEWRQRRGSLVPLPVRALALHAVGSGALSHGRRREARKDCHCQQDLSHRSPSRTGEAPGPGAKLRRTIPARNGPGRLPMRDVVRIFARHEGTPPVIAQPAPKPGILARRDEILRALGTLVPGDGVIGDVTRLKPYETDGLAAYRQVPLAVVLPRTTEQVAAVLRYCHQTGLRVVPRGAGTSLSGGALPLEDAVVIGLMRMNRILDINLDDRFAVVEAGVTNIGITNAVAGDGFFYAPDPSSQLACMIGGNVMMNSGGAHCLKYGVTANNLLGLKFVTIEGEVIDIGGAHLDAAGYDWLGLITGSEGQLGIVTEVTVRILRGPEGARAMLAAFDSTEVAGAAVDAIIGSGIIPVALEFMDKPCIHACEDFAHAGYPLDAEAMLIIEVEGSIAEQDDLLGRIKAICQRFAPISMKLAESPEQSLAIWKGRKGAFGAVGRISPDYLCMDGTIPTSELPHVLKRITEMSAQFDLKVANVFHAGDGNLHPLIMFDANDPASFQRAEAFGAAILTLCVEVGGCLTGEHGVGVEKRDLMTVQFTARELDQQRALKTAFDPQWLLNPSKVFPLAGAPAAMAAE
jgi:glycolate oxidase